MQIIKDQVDQAHGADDGVRRCWPTGYKWKRCYCLKKTQDEQRGKTLCTERIPTLLIYDYYYYITYLQLMRL